jgi:hypothetical protein
VCTLVRCSETATGDVFARQDLFCGALSRRGVGKQWPRGLAVVLTVP